MLTLLPKETKDGDVILTCDVMTQALTVALYSHYDTVKSRAGHKQYRKWRLCIASLKKQAVLPICEPLFSVNYRGGRGLDLPLICLVDKRVVRVDL